MKAILHIFIFFILANTIALSVVDTWLDSEELTEISSEESEEDSEEEKSDERELLNIDMIATNLNIYFSKKVKHTFGDHVKNYAFNYAKTHFSPPKMMI